MILVVGAAMFYAGYLYLVWNPSWLWEPQQDALADKLGVNIGDYPYPHIFPYGYYWRQLPRDAYIDQVHSVVNGYAKVLKCNNSREIYYFFSQSDDFALRIEFWYDEAHKLVQFNGEDEDSRTIRTEECAVGLIQ